MNTKYTPVISIVIPTYNHSNYLSKALESVLAQTYKNWEAVIIDNHSTDDTDKVIKKFNDPRIRYLKIHNYGVIAKSRNTGILEAKGEWVAFLDSDDWWTPDKLKISMDYTNSNIDLIYHDVEIVSSKSQLFKRKILKSRQLKKPILIDLLVNGNIISNSSVIVRKQILKKIGLIDECKELIAAEDYNTWLKISNLTDQFLYLPKRLGYYFLHDRNISKKDISHPVRLATFEFSSVLNNKQKIKLEANIKYLSARFNYLNFNYKKIIKKLLFVLKNGRFKLKLYSLIMIINIIIKFKYYYKH